MRATDLVLRGYAERRNGQWEAYCIDLCLAAQADTPEEAISRLNDQILDYVREALAGDDSEFARQLLTKRKAPLYYRLRYKWLRLSGHWKHLKKNTVRLFDTPLPMGPQKPA